MKLIKDNERLEEVIGVLDKYLWNHDCDLDDEFCFAVREASKVLKDLTVINTDESTKKFINKIYKMTKKGAVEWSYNPIQDSYEAKIVELRLHLFLWYGSFGNDTEFVSFSVDKNDKADIIETSSKHYKKLNKLWELLSK